jgi:hypothetical protein
VELLATYLRRSMPVQFVEPERLMSYSNHGLTLVGELVEEVAEGPFGSTCAPSCSLQDLRYDQGRPDDLPLIERALFAAFGLAKRHHLQCRRAA